MSLIRTLDRWFGSERQPPLERQYTFSSYEDYVRAQVTANHQKIEKVWLTEAEAWVIASIVQHRLFHASRGLCHGSRNGWECRWFAEHLRQEVVGTDIADTAPAHGLVQHDFHEPRADFTQAFDWVYSNAIDHAYDPRKALRAWLGQLKPGGLVLLHWSPEHDRADHQDAGTEGADAYQASKAGYRQLARDCGTLVDVVTTDVGARCILVVAP